MHTNHWVDALVSHFHWTAFILSAVLFSSLSLSLCAPHPPFSCLPLLRGAERLALQQQRKDGMSTGFREKWVGGEKHRDGKCMLCFHLRHLKFATYQHATRRCPATPVTHACPETFFSSEARVTNGAKSIPHVQQLHSEGEDFLSI